MSTDEPCDHEDYDIDILDGRCRCVCGHGWYASNDQVLAEIERQQEYSDYENRENSRRRRRLIWGGFLSGLAWPLLLWPRKRPTDTGDDIPF